ncbi:MAG: GNAT family N-acetyltransferase [Nitrospirota bacterium]|nr:GNAT family N-acetyltransferase [Nitrospirota bacterium]
MKPKPPHRLRPMGPEDIGAVAWIESVAMGVARRDEAWHTMLTHPAYRSRVLEETGPEAAHVVGFVTFSVAGGEGGILNMAVAPEARRRGYGRELLMAVLEGCRAERARSIYLEVRRHNRGARALYVATGFVQVGERPGYYTGPADDALVMRLDLKPYADARRPEAPAPEA